MQTIVRLQREEFNARRKLRADARAHRHRRTGHLHRNAAKPNPRAIAALTLEHYRAWRRQKLRATSRKPRHGGRSWASRSFTVMGGSRRAKYRAGRHRLVAPPAAFAAAEFLMDYLKTRRHSGSRREHKRQDLGRGKGRRRCCCGALAEARRPRGRGIVLEAAC